MKKSIFLLAAALVGFTACTNEEVTEIASGRAIGFAAPGVNNITKAVNDVETAQLSEFYVFGYYGETPTTVFTNEKVTKGTSNWNSATTQYWTADQTYQFAAYSNGNAKIENNVAFANKTLTITDYAAGTSDLLVSATKEETTDATLTDESPVSLTFNHALSKVKFTFSTTVAANYKVTISNLKFTVPNTGDYSNATNAWTNVDTNAEKSFTVANNIVNETAQSSDECYVIPQTNNTFNVTFTATMTDDGNFKVEKNFTATLASGDLTGATAGNAGNNTWVPGFGYNYTATLEASDFDLDETNVITFSPSVDAWKAAGDSPVDPTEAN